MKESVTALAALELSLELPAWKADSHDPSELCRVSIRRDKLVC
jgi:hypothetical protein